MPSSALEPRFHGVRHDGYLAWPSLLPGRAASPFLRRSFRVSGLLSGRFRVPFRRASGRATGASFRCQARSWARPGEVASPAVASRGGTLGVTAKLPDATDSLVTNGEILTTVSHSSGWLADVGATVRGCRDDGCGHARTRSASDVQNLSALRNSVCLPSSEADLIASIRSYMGVAFD
jgi:hypothetical protein